uniref:BLOC-1-related complex subunit 8 n=1 Tax=Steinernema glaseri TaxID=37863 RepID=A0A1I7ZCW0_9BILA
MTSRVKEDLPPPPSKELQARCRILAERLSESAHIVDHDPSLALYRLQEHVSKSLPVLVNRKYQMKQLNSNLQGACFDLDNAIAAVESMKKASTTFDSIQEKLRNCLYYKQQLDYENNRTAPSSKPLKQSKSYHGRAAPRNEDSSPE